jgi:hypothetical protein
MLADNTADYEVTLAQHKVLTINKKLEVIPVLQQIITAENTLITAEQGKLVQTNSLIGVQREIANKKATIIPLYTELMTQIALLNAALTTQITTLGEIANEKLAIAQNSLDSAISRLAKATTLLEIEELQSAGYAIKREIDLLKMDLSKDLIELEIDSMHSITNAILSTTGEINTSDKYTNQAVVNQKLFDIATEKSSKISASSVITTSDRNRMIDVQQLSNAEQREVAVLRAISNITATLVHTLVTT